MNLFYYLVSESDYEDDYKELLTDNLSDAVEQLEQYKDEKFVVIKVFEEGRLAYRQSWKREELPSKDIIIENVLNRVDEYWQC